MMSQSIDCCKRTHHQMRKIQRHFRFDEINCLRLLTIVIITAEPIKFSARSLSAHEKYFVQTQKPNHRCCNTHIHVIIMNRNQENVSSSNIFIFELDRPRNRNLFLPENNAMQNRNHLILFIECYSDRVGADETIRSERSHCFRRFFFGSQYEMSRANVFFWKSFEDGNKQKIKRTFSSGSTPFVFTKCHFYICPLHRIAKAKLLSLHSLRAQKIEFCNFLSLSI